MNLYSNLLRLTFITQSNHLGPREKGPMENSGKRKKNDDDEDDMVELDEFGAVNHDERPWISRNPVFNFELGANIE